MVYKKKKKKRYLFEKLGRLYSGSIQIVLFILQTYYFMFAFFNFSFDMSKIKMFIYFFGNTDICTPVNKILISKYVLNLILNFIINVSHYFYYNLNEIY